MGSSLPTEVGVWATEVPSRSPRFKVHTSRGHARAALSYSWGQAPRHDCPGKRYCAQVRGGTLYERVGADWVPRCEIAMGAPECSVPWRAEKNAKRAEAEELARQQKRDAEERALVDVLADHRARTYQFQARAVIDALDAHRKVHGSAF